MYPDSSRVVEIEFGDERPRYLITLAKEPSPTAVGIKALDTRKEQVVIIPLKDWDKICEAVADMRSMLGE